MRDERTTRRVAAGAAGLAGGALAACAPGGGDGAAPAGTPGAARPVKLELATDWTTSTRKPVIELLRDEFVRQHPHVTVDLQFAPRHAAAAARPTRSGSSPRWRPVPPRT